MNRIYILAFILLFPIVIFSQIDIPLFSEPAAISQRVGYTDFQITYERPKANKRTIFGGLVPYDQVWRAGAGPCTTISFTTDVFINNKQIKAGKYSLFTIPKKESWTFILNRDTTLYGAYDYSQKLDVVRIESKVSFGNKWRETFNFNFDVVNDIAVVNLSWEDLNVSFNIETKAYENLRKSALAAIASDQPIEEGSYTVAAEYIMHNKVGFGEDYLLIAEQLVDKALKVEKENHYNYYKKREILKLQNNKEEYFQYSNLLIKYLERARPYEGYEESIEQIKLEVKNFDN